MLNLIEQIPSEPVIYMVIGLVITALLVLLLPFFVRIIEHNLEIFFLIMGVLAVTISGLWNRDLIIEALKAPVIVGSIPVGIFQVVLVFGIMLFYFNNKFCRLIFHVADKLSLRIFIFILVLLLGLLSSIVSVIVTAILLSEIIVVLPLDKKNRIRLLVVSCFAISLGAVLTPLGEPLSTILVQKLAGPPFHAGFTFLLTHFAIYVIPGVFLLAFLAAIWIRKDTTVQSTKIVVEDSENLRGVILRAFKVYAFVVALVLLGEGFKPLIVWYIIRIPAYGLYWFNIFSAVLDNATLTAVEITVAMSISKIICIIMGLLVAGGMLIPGNIPNIVAAGRMKITMKEWAMIGLPVGLALMVVYFLALLPVMFK